VHGFIKKGVFYSPTERRGVSCDIHIEENLNSLLPLHFILILEGYPDTAKFVAAMPPVWSRNPSTNSLK